VAPVASNNLAFVKVLIVKNDGSKQSFEVAYWGAGRDFPEELKVEMGRRSLNPNHLASIEVAFELPDGSEFRQVIQNGQEPTAEPTGDTGTPPNWLPSWGEIFRTHVPWCLALALGVYNVGVWERQWQPEQ
jgi:hypothetical protein